MPEIDVNGVRLHYTEAGQGSQAILFSHGFLMSHAMFAPQIAALSKPFRCVAYDHRGQARSAVPESGYDIETVTADAEALIERLDLKPCHFVGLSMGGFVGMRLGFRRPDLLRSLILMDTSADPEPNALKYRVMGLAARYLGLASVADRAMNILFGKTFMTDPARTEERAAWRRHLVEGHDKEGILRA